MQMAARGPIWLLGCSIVVYLMLAIPAARAKRPRTDEAHLGSPAINLVTNGVMATTIFETAGTHYRTLDRYSYWQMPFNLLLQAGWYRLFGYEIGVARLLPVCWGVLLIVTLWGLLGKLGTGSTAAVAGAALLAVQYEFVMITTDTRPDALCALLNFAGLLAYLHWRETRLALAIFAGSAAVVASVLTHPNGVLGGLVLLTLYLWWDRGRFEWRHVLWAAAPVLVGFGAWGLYIVRDIAAFKEQFFYNAQDDSRLAMLLQPWRGVWLELTAKYFGLFSGFVAGGPILLRAKLFGTLVMLGAVAYVAWTPSMRRERGWRLLVVVTGIYFFTLAVFDGQKQYIYMIHMVPLFCAAVAGAAVTLWREKPALRWLLTAVLAGFVLLQAGGVLYRIRENTYGRLFMPAVNYLKAHAGENDLIFASGEFGFGLGFSPRVLDDIRLGQLSGRVPAYVVEDVRYRENWEGYRIKQPALYAHIEKVLLERSEKVYEAGGYIIYRRR